MKRRTTRKIRRNNRARRTRKVRKTRRTKQHKRGGRKRKSSSRSSRSSQRASVQASKSPKAKAKELFKNYNTMEKMGRVIKDKGVIERLKMLNKMTMTDNLFNNRDVGVYGFKKFVDRNFTKKFTSDLSKHNDDKAHVFKKIGQLSKCTAEFLMHGTEMDTQCFEDFGIKNYKKFLIDMQKTFKLKRRHSVAGGSRSSRAVSSSPGRSSRRSSRERFRREARVAGLITKRLIIISLTLLSAVLCLFFFPSIDYEARVQMGEVYTKWGKGLNKNYHGLISSEYCKNYNTTSGALWDYGKPHRIPGTRRCMQNVWVLADPGRDIHGLNYIKQLILSQIYSDYPVDAESDVGVILMISVSWILGMFLAKSLSLIMKYFGSEGKIKDSIKGIKTILGSEVGLARYAFVTYGLVGTGMREFGKVLVRIGQKADEVGVSAEEIEDALKDVDEVIETLENE